MRNLCLTAVGAAVAAIVVASASSLRAIETTYGEDPVPDTHRSLRPPYTAYGMDPIPVKSPLERWQEFRYYRPARPRSGWWFAPADDTRGKWRHGTR